MDCNTCKERRKQAEPVPFQTHEADMARMERTIQKLWIVIIILTLSVVGMFVYEMQFETVTITAEQQADGDSNNYAVGGDYYGLPAESNG